MARPIDISENNTPIPENYDGNAGKGNCKCGGKGCKTTKGPESAVKESGCSCGCRPGKRCAVSGLLAALLVSGGIALAGWAVGCGIHSISAAQNVVTVRGFAEQDVKADLALWNIGFVATGSDLAGVQQKVESDNMILRAFLKKNGITDDEMIELPTSMVDLMSREYRSEGADNSRYIVNTGLRVRTSQVDVVRDLSGMKIGELIKAGVTLKENQQPVYVYTKLQDIKPAMVAEATGDARRAAQQFAKDSGARLGQMKSASQGVFQFLPRDKADGVMESAEINKTVRVVTSVSYLLEN